MKVNKFMAWLKPFLVLSIICGFAFTATAQNYYPAEIGNTWTLNSADGTQQRRYTIREAEDFNGLEVRRLTIDEDTLGTGVVVTDLYLITVDDTGLTLHRSDTNEGPFGIATIIYDPPNFFFPSSPTLGQMWQISGETELQLVGATSNTTSVEVVAFEDVVTPAGTFKDCAKIQLSYKVTTALVTLRPIVYIWLAPDVGPVRFENDQNIVFDLVSYSLVEPPAVEDIPVVEETPTVEETSTTEETPVIVEEPVVEEPMVTKTFGFDLTLEPGLNMISIPLMPEEPYTAKSLAEMLKATLVIRLDLATQSFSAYTTVDEGTGFSIDGGKGYILNTPTGGIVTFTGTAWDNQPESEYLVEEDVLTMNTGDYFIDGPGMQPPPPEEEPDADDAPAAPALSTNKNTWAFVVTSDIRDMETGTGYTLVAENLRTGTIATETITSDVKRSSAVWADLNRKSVVEAGDKLEIALYDERGNIVSGPFQRTVSTDDIRNAFLSLQLTVGDVRPKDTILAQNYPNPFNPETWIPYQLSKSAEVSIHIHNVAGHLIRTLDLGLKSTGSYMTPSTAAYWDGKNSVGERVASGIYFYTLQTTDFAATRRMVILK